MNNILKAVLSILCLIIGLNVAAQQKQTFIYAVKDTDTLRLDYYPVSGNAKKPCVIFMFGGGFMSGERDREHYVGYFKFLNGKGFEVVSIDYRLGFKKASEQKLPERKFKAKDFLNLFENTIFMAVEDLYDATNYVLQNADNWNIDKNKIVLSGSSAGAISVLQAEYERCNRTEIAKRLPDGFKYAGVVAFAGAIYSNHGNLKWKDTPAPLQLFHGDADKNVPFEKIKIAKWGFFGSKYIAERYDKQQYPYYFYQVQNTAHEMADTPMRDNLDEINEFLQAYVLGNKPAIINTNILPLYKPVIENKKFKIKDYITTNFGG